MATEAELEEAGLFVQFPHSIYMGHAYGRPVYFSNAAGITINAGGRSGKFRDIIARNLLAGTALHTIFMLDPKGEGAAVSQDQTADGKYCAYWNALALHGLPQDNINFLGHLTIDSPTLVPDLKVLWENLLPKGKGSDSDYFVPRGQQFGEALSLAIIELTGVLTFPTLYEAINLVMSESEEWLDFAFHMSRSQFASVRAVEAEIAASRKDSGNGFRGIMGELFKSVACLSDPLLMASVSPPFTMDLKDIVESDQAWQVYLMAPAEFLQAWSAVIKSGFVAVMLLKSRAPAARRITFLIDECGQLVSGSGGGFGLVPRLFSYGAGVGCQPIIVTQSHQQMDDLAPGAKDLILSSAGASLMFAMRGDWESCQDCSRRLGNRTVEYDDALAQERAVHARNQALQSLIQGGDPLQAGMALAHQGFEMGYQTKQARPLQTPDELMNMPSDRAWLFHEDVPYPIEIERRPYWDTPGLSFHPNPYHPPLDRVTVMTRWGRRTRRVITEPVPERFAHYPQYRHGMWSRIGR
ncbi:MAG: type IV secretory system conjugative DNA transfer family protein [Pseudomonadota bacterium]